jgi:hypothetical protein
LETRQVLFPSQGAYGDFFYDITEFVGDAEPRRTNGILKAREGSWRAKHEPAGEGTIFSCLQDGMITAFEHGYLMAALPYYTEWSKYVIEETPAGSGVFGLNIKPADNPTEEPPFGLLLISGGGGQRVTKDELDFMSDRVDALKAKFR